MAWSTEEADEVDDALGRLAMCTRTDVDPPTLAAYERMLDDLAAEDVVTACDQLCRSSQWFPKVVEVREAAVALALTRGESKAKAEAVARARDKVLDAERELQAQRAAAPADPTAWERMIASLRERGILRSWPGRK